jgi:glycosyltransferase involved in cell wall biosynthesis
MASVFIGIPTINRPEFVRDAIRSALNQTYTDIEVVVSDNDSEPGVADSIKEFIEEFDDHRIRFHQQLENVGEYGQGRYFFNEAANSQYFMILHDDDILGEKYLEKAIEGLEKSAESAFFVADAGIIDENGNHAEAVKQQFLKDHGRNKAVQGEFSVIDRHLQCGFTLISGTLFRTEILKTSGFVDPEGVGNFPFETDVFLRIGDLGASAWYQKEELLTFRFHTGSMRHYIKLFENEITVDAMIRLLSQRQYTGYSEGRREAILGRLHRAKALIYARQGKSDECRKSIMKCFEYNKMSVRLWLAAPLALIAPGVLKWFLPELPVALEAPKLRNEK